MSKGSHDKAQQFIRTLKRAALLELDSATPLNTLNFGTDSQRAHLFLNEDGFLGPMPIRNVLHIFNIHVVFIIIITRRRHGARNGRKAGHITESTQRQPPNNIQCLSVCLFTLLLFLHACLSLNGRKYLLWYVHTTHSTFYSPNTHTHNSLSQTHGDNGLLLRSFLFSSFPGPVLLRGGPVDQPEYREEGDVRNKKKKSFTLVAKLNLREFASP